MEQWLQTIRDTGAGLAMLGLVALAVAHVLVRRWARNRAGQYDADAVDRLARATRVRWWLARTVRDLLPPVALLLWVHAAFLIAATALPVWTAGAAGGGVALRWLYGLTLATALFWLLARCAAIAEALLLALSRRADTTWERVMLPLAGTAVRQVLPVGAIVVGVRTLALPAGVERTVHQAVAVLLIVLMAWMFFRAVKAVATLILSRYRVDVSDNLQARAIHTQVVVLERVAGTVIVVFALASILMTFDSLRQFGGSILASAGIAGIVVGLAAQRSIATLLAGFQIALTQPIRIDDVVIVENEWGQVEDITLTYVVVRIWDQRRLIVPITYFIEKPFQNWTRASADLLGTVFLHVDYTVPVAALREELTRILRASPLWDGRVNVLQVTDAKEFTLEVRALASAANASQAWDLRCEVREQLVDFLQRTCPESLPRVRTVRADDVPVARATERRSPGPAGAAV
ncbi:MAG: mechanosensitive ion channel family protein [Vicinamibacterales bacterium]